jgi:hypothetical protein
MLAPHHFARVIAGRFDPGGFWRTIEFDAMQLNGNLRFSMQTAKLNCPRAPRCRYNQCGQLHVPLAVGVPVVRAACDFRSS